MPGALTLYDGPAGSGKSQAVKEAIESGEIDAVADLTTQWAAMTGAERDPDGNYPDRTALDPVIATGLAAYIRRAVVRQGLRSGLRMAVTSGTPGTAPEYAAIAAELSATFQQRTIDPGETAARARLAGPDGVVSPECDQAIRRWYET